MLRTLSFVGCFIVVIVAGVNGRQNPLRSDQSATSHAHVWEAELSHRVDPIKPVPVDFIAAEWTVVTNVSIGTPPQVVSLALDLISTDVLALSHSPKGSPAKHHFYNHAKSSTYIANGKVVDIVDKYDTGAEYYGSLSQDDVTIGAIRVPNYSFVELEGADKSLSVHLAAGADGVLGLGPARAREDQRGSIVRSMSQLDPQVIGLQFAEDSAQVVFGGVNGAYEPGDFSFYDQDATAMQWTGSAAEVEVVRRFGSISDFVLSNSPYIFVPNTIFQATLAALDVVNGILPCRGPGHDIRITVGENVRVTMQKKDYTIEISPGICIVTLFPTNKPHWIFGRMFLSRVYSVLEFNKGDKPDRVGFANLKKQQ